MTRLDLHLKQKLNLTTNLITSIELIALNSIELYSFLERESENNVFIDYDVFIEDKMFRDYIRNNNKIHQEYNINENDDIDSQQDYAKYEPTLRETLLEQLGTISLTEEEISIGTMIIYNIDDDGYFKIEAKEISQLLNVKDENVLSMLKKIQSFEPAGIGARNLKECLLLQIEQEDEILSKIISRHLDDIYKNNIKKIMSSLKIDLDILNKHIEKVKSLNPKPASGYKTNNYNTLYIYPDVFLENSNGVLTAKLKDSISNIHVNEYYLKLLDMDIDNDTKEYLKEKLSRTMFLMDSIEKRKKTIQKVVDKIIDIQKDYFIKNRPLKPMNLKDIASSIQISESTVSRAIKNKYMQTQKGLYELKYFFSSHISTLEEDTSKDFVYKKIKKIIENENPQKPLSDQKITDILNEEGINIKRRTVSKYREELNIPIANNRKTFDTI